MQIIKNREVVHTRWLPEPDLAQPDALDGRILPLEAWLEQAKHSPPSGRMDGLPGVLLEPDDGPEPLERWLSAIPVIAINAENFADGRIYSLAFELRQFYHYEGEIRALGAIYDNLSMMEQCGFDAFVLKQGLSPEEAIPYFTEIGFDYSLR